MNSNHTLPKLFVLTFLLLYFGSAKAAPIFFPDPAFKANLLTADANNGIALDSSGNPVPIDLNSDGEIDAITEAPQIFGLNVQLASITDITGVNSFNNLKSFQCGSNMITGTLSLVLPQLEEFFCENNLITDLNMNTPNLKKLGCGGNQLTYINESMFPLIEVFNCNNNQLNSINLNAFPNLISFDIGGNPIGGTIDISSLPNLTDAFFRSTNIIGFNCNGHNKINNIFCENSALVSLDAGSSNVTSISAFANQISYIDVSNCPRLVLLSINNNQVKTLDLSGTFRLLSFDARINQLVDIFMKNGGRLNNALLGGNPNLQYICADSSELSIVQNILNSEGYTNCTVNTYCNFVPGGQYFSVTGKVIYDDENNGCDISDVSIANQGFVISSSGVPNQMAYSGSSIYNINLTPNTYTITPIASPYFNILPSNITMNFIANPLDVFIDFCFTPIGVFNDLEVSIIPLGPARPGFDSKYKIIYKNIGTTIQSGTVDFNFNDTILDFLSSNPSISNSNFNQLIWNFSNLSPFEKREIEITLNLNSPVETPPVNINDILVFSTNIQTTNIDETPNNNNSSLIQTVVGSYDPNDKTCVEGSVVPSNESSEYIHYVIRFENTGNFVAENIVVKDTIDITKFDINSLVPLSASHPYFINVFSNNVVEFIFENIQLPFADSTNDGYVAFSIKTLPTLLIGDTLSNKADIFFDFNAPIITNKTYTVIDNPSTSIKNNFTQNDFSVFPNPTKNILNISSKNNSDIKSIAVFNSFGQLVLDIPSAKDIRSINTEKLSHGYYLIKISTKESFSTLKFLKAN